MRNICFKLWTPYLTTGSEFYKTVSLNLDHISVYIIYKFHVNHLKKKRDLGQRKSRKWKVFRWLPEVDESISDRPYIFWYYKRHTFNWYRFHCKTKTLKFSIFFIASGDNREWRSTRLTPQHLSTTQDLSPLKMSSLYL